MTEPQTEPSAPRSRRSVLAAAAGAVAATAATAITHPAGVLAGTDGDVVLGAENVAGTTTVIRTIDGPALEAHSEVGITFVAFGDDLSTTAILAQADRYGLVARGGITGSGVVAVANTSGEPTSPISDWGMALEVRGPASFSRSGRVTVARGKAHADIDLRSKGGVTGALCFANLMSYRRGVYVSAVRPNYPIVGKARIYLNKALSSPAYVAWLVLNAPDPIPDPLPTP